MAIELAEDDDIEVKTVVANDDVPSAPNDKRSAEQKQLWEHRSTK